MPVCFQSDKCSFDQSKKQDWHVRGLLFLCHVKGQEGKCSVSLPSHCLARPLPRKGMGCCRTLRTWEPTRDSQAPFERGRSLSSSQGWVFEWESERFEMSFPNSRYTLPWATQVKGDFRGDLEARVESWQTCLDRMKHQNTVVSTRTYKGKKNFFFFFF